VTDPTEARQFSTVISGLQRAYPPEKMEEISTSFCFICLLHLANEQGLKLESVLDQPIETGDEVEKKVGNIWDLQVRAIPSWILMLKLKYYSPGVQGSECLSICIDE
jgi:condensin complex subunit 2